MNLRKFNLYAGWILFAGIVISQFVFTVICVQEGRMMPFLALLLAIIYFPFLLFSCASVLNPEKYQKEQNILIILGLLFQFLFSLILPLFFDEEFVYLAIIPLILTIVLILFRKKREIQLVILNCLGLLTCLIVFSLGI
jgi:hypothetical protein